MFKNIKQWRSTLLGVSGIAVSILVARGLVPESATGSLSENLDQIISGVLSVCLIFFAKD